MHVQISDSLRPAYFVSYSRKQTHIANDLKDTLAKVARAIWFDLDSIVVGDDWVDEIYQGLYDCDELVLLVSDESLRSPIVEKELEIVREQGKPIRPIIVTRLTAPLPVSLACLQYVDLSRVNSGTDLKSALVSLLKPNDARHDGTMTFLKAAACRAIWPAFNASFASSQGRMAVCRQRGIWNEFAIVIPDRVPFGSTPASCIAQAAIGK